MKAAEVVLITGISGSGKSVALHALEDAGYFCVDNLPPELLLDFVRLELDRYDRLSVRSIEQWLEKHPVRDLSVVSLGREPLEVPDAVSA